MRHLVVLLPLLLIKKVPALGRKTTASLTPSPVTVTIRLTNG